MTTEASRENPERGLPGNLRVTALAAVLAGAAGSEGLMLFVGRHNSSRTLLVLFTLWVLSPFMALLLANAVSPRWPVLTRATLYGAMLALATGSLIIYGYVALHPPKAQAAFVFVVVPPASWLVLATALSIAALASRARSRQK